MIKLAGLDCIRIERSPEKETVILLHGYGANANDLATLAAAFPALSECNFIFPQGPHLIPIGPGIEGNAWFPIDEEALNQAMSSGTHRKLEEIDPPGLDKSLADILRLLTEINQPLDKVILGGFSQGAMLSLEVALNLPQAFKGLLLFSGALLKETIWKQKASQLTSTRFFQSHGVYDPLLSFNAAKRLFDILKNADHHGEFHSFDGGHEIPQDIINNADKFLTKIMQ